MATSNFDSHAQWVRALRESQPQRASNSSLADDLAFHLSGGVVAAPATAAAFHENDVPWDHLDASTGSTFSFTDSYDVEVHDDMPVYRSFGHLQQGFSDLAVYDDDNALAYGSLNGDNHHADGGNAVAEDEWRSRMPPLVCRQQEFLVPCL